MFFLRFRVLDVLQQTTTTTKNTHYFLLNSSMKHNGTHCLYCRLISLSVQQMPRLFLHTFNNLQQTILYDLKNLYLYLLYSFMFICLRSSYVLTEFKIHNIQQYQSTNRKQIIDIIRFVIVFKLATKFGCNVQ